MDRHESDLFQYALRQGDTALVLGQRLSEWTGRAPALELEMASANLALDLIGEAQLFLAYAGEVEGAGRDADALAFTRDVLDFKNLLIVEQPNGDWAFTVARHYLFSAYHRLYAEKLSGSADARLAEIAGKTLNEIAYHLRFSREWVLRLGGGTEESHARLQGAFDRLWRFTGEMFAMDEVERRLAEEGIAVDAAALEPEWRSQVDRIAGEAGVTIPEVKRMTTGGRIGHHSEHLGHLLAEMQFMQRTYPGLQW